MDHVKRFAAALISILMETVFLSKWKQLDLSEISIFHRSMAGADGKRSVSELQTGPVEP